MGGVVGGVVDLLGAIILGIYLFRLWRASRPKNVNDPSPLPKNQKNVQYVSLVLTDATPIEPYDTNS